MDGERYFCMSNLMCQNMIQAENNYLFKAQFLPKFSHKDIRQLFQAYQISCPVQDIGFCTALLAQNT